MMRAGVLALLCGVAGCGATTAPKPSPSADAASNSVRIPKLQPRGSSDTEGEAGNSEAKPTFEEQKLEQCSKLVKAINDTVDGFDNIDDLGVDSSENQLRGLVRAMNRTSRELGKLELTIPELQTLAGRYRAMVDEVAVSAQSMAAAAREGDLEALRSAQVRMDRATAQEDPLVSAINQYCQSSLPGSEDREGVEGW